MTINDKAAKISPGTARERSTPTGVATDARRLAPPERKGQENQSAERERLRGDNEAAQRDAQKTIEFQNSCTILTASPRREFRHV